MKGRCGNPKDIAYRNYGGRGITVFQRSEEWFESFIKDVGLAPSPEHSIDQIDMNGNYEPGNVKWALQAEQHENRRKTVWIEFDGKKKTLNAWAAQTGMRPGTIYHRLVAGWSAEEALSRGVRHASRDRKSSND